MRFRDLYSDDLRLCILPPRERCGECANHCIFSRDDYDTRLGQIRGLRGKVFLADGAISPEHLDEHGGYCTRFDQEAWHIYLMRKDGSVCACCTPMLHGKGAQIEDLRMHELLARMEREQRGPYESAIRLLIREARERRIGFGEAAAWAVDEDVRNRRASMMVAVAAWPLYQTLGDAIVIGAPTLRHHTSTIEKRFGGFALAHEGSDLAPFYDAEHGCEMEFVWFDSQKPLAKFVEIIGEMRTHFETLQTCACRAR